MGVESPWKGTSTSTGFKYRILLADGDVESAAYTADCLQRDGYLVIVAHDGFEALAELRAGLPEVIISDLELPRMSGFELLAVVRKRFAGIGVIARSNEFYPADMPEGILADRYVRKSASSYFELAEAVRQLLTELPLRAAPPRADIAPAWMSRTSTGYIVLTCPSCLRSSSVRLAHPEFGVIREDVCVACGEKIKYRLDRNVVEKVSELTVAQRAQERVDITRKIVAESRKSIDDSAKRMGE